MCSYARKRAKSTGCCVVIVCIDVHRCMQCIDICAFEFGFNIFY